MEVPEDGADSFDVFDFDQHEKQLMAEKATVHSKFVQSTHVEFTDNLDATADAELSNMTQDNDADPEISNMTKDKDIIMNKDNDAYIELSSMTKDDEVSITKPNDADIELGYDNNEDDDDEIGGDHVVPNAEDLTDRPDSQADSEATEGRVRVRG